MTKIWTQRRWPTRLKQIILEFGKQPNVTFAYLFEEPFPQIFKKSRLAPACVSANKVVPSVQFSYSSPHLFNRVKPAIKLKTNKPKSGSQAFLGMFPGLGISVRWKEQEKRKASILWEFLTSPDTPRWRPEFSLCVWLKNFQAKMPGKQKKKADIVSVILDETHVKALLNNATS